MKFKKKNSKCSVKPPTFTFRIVEAYVNVTNIFTYLTKVIPSIPTRPLPGPG